MPDLCSPKDMRVQVTLLSTVLKMRMKLMRTGLVWTKSRKGRFLYHLRNNFCCEILRTGLASNKHATTWWPRLPARDTEFGLSEKWSWRQTGIQKVTAALPLSIFLPCSLTWGTQGCWDTLALSGAELECCPPVGTTDRAEASTSPRHVRTVNLTVASPNYSLKKYPIHSQIHL